MKGLSPWHITPLSKKFGIAEHNSPAGTCQTFLTCILQKPHSQTKSAGANLTGDVCRRFGHENALI
jgi:hypothetical protein